MILFLLKITDFCPRKISLELKKLFVTKKIQLGFSAKIEVPSSAQLGSETFQLGLAQLGKSWLELITTYLPTYVQENSNATTKFD